MEELKIALKITKEKNLRGKFDQVARTINIQVSKLQNQYNNIQRKEQTYYSKVISAIKEGDRQRAAIYSNEVAEVRKALKSINQSKLVLEQIGLRLNTVKDIGDIVTALAPANNLIQSIKSSMSTIVPTAGNEMDSLQDMMTGVLVDATQSGAVGIDMNAASDEAAKILQEVESQVQRETEIQLPSAPDAPEAIGV